MEGEKRKRKREREIPHSILIRRAIAPEIDRCFLASSPRFFFSLYNLSGLDLFCPSGAFVRETLELGGILFKMSQSSKILTLAADPTVFLVLLECTPAGAHERVTKLRRVYSARSAGDPTSHDSGIMRIQYI